MLEELGTAVRETAFVGMMAFTAHPDRSPVPLLLSALCFLLPLLPMSVFGELNKSEVLLGGAFKGCETLPPNTLTQAPSPILWVRDSRERAVYSVGRRANQPVPQLGEAAMGQRACSLPAASQDDQLVYINGILLAPRSLTQDRDVSFYQEVCSSPRSCNIGVCFLTLPGSQGSVILGLFGDRRSPQAPTGSLEL